MLTCLKRFARGCLAAVVLAAAGLPLAASAGEVWYPYGSKLGADGRDVVAYFSEGQAVKGVEEHAVDFGGTRWLFSSGENRDAFAADPARYVPQYGGYCAYAMGKGYQAFGNPEVWTVHEGRLFFNYSSSVQNSWTASRQDLIESADRNWPGVVESKSQ